MSFESEIRTLESKFDQQWSETPVKYPNISLDVSSLSEWVSMIILNDEGRIAQIGSSSNLYRYYGFIVNQVFVRPNTGSRRAFDLADLIATLWRINTISNITILQPVLDTIGVRDGWFQINISHEYRRNEYKTPSNL